MIQVMMRFVGSTQWDGGDKFPYPVKIPRIPVENEYIETPSGRWQVVEIIYDYSNGLAYEPTIGIICCKPYDVKLWKKALGRDETS